MIHQVVAIHGGDTFRTYEEYLAFLTSFDFDPASLRGKDWKANLGQALGDGFEALTPRLPNSWNAKFTEWKIWFEKIVPYLEPEVTLIGHSLGGTFLAKYLAENELPKRVRGAFLVAAPFGDCADYSLCDFSLPDSLERLAAQSGKIFLYHSADDPVVPFADLARYRAALPRATVRTFADRQHFSQAELPEIVADILSLR